MNKEHNNISHYLALSVSALSLVVALLSGVTFVSNIDKTNAIQETQIDSINKRLDRIETKLDQLKN